MGARLCCCSCCADLESFNTDARMPFNYHASMDTSNRLSFSIKTQTISDHEDHDSFSFIPSVRIKQTRNGVVGFHITNLLQITNASNLYNNWNAWFFELCYKFIYHDDTDLHSKWKTVTFTPDKVTQKGMFYIKIKLHLYDYELHCKVRAKHKTIEQYFPYSSLLKVNIVSSLIDSTFDVGEYINFLDQKNMYTKEGFIDKLLPDSYIRIKCKHNDRKLVTVHRSRVYTAPIYLGFVIDLTNTMDVDKNMLLRKKTDDDEDIMSIYCALIDVYKQYALEIYGKKNILAEPFRDCDAMFMGRFVSKNIVGFLFVPYYKEPKIGCLVREDDGWISIKSYIHHCLNRHQKGIENETEDVKMANLQELWSYCDICSIEISRYDWITSCNVEIYNSHVMCLFCVNNKIEQKEQLYHLLHGLLRHWLYDDCIEQLVGFVVGRVVAHQPIL